ncbi:MAG: hypothetical protein K9G49_03620 [Taibaiella sp.]|nr:hypothetical protein [Taibaiella sp.]
MAFTLIAMKPIKQIALGAIVTLSIFCAVLYSSCAKNECGAVTCLNKGTCMGGICKCIQGIEGANCEIIYRKMYANTYVGTPPDDPASDTTNMLIFVATDDTTNYSSMEVLWIDTAGLTVVKLPVELSNNSSGGSSFNIIPTTKASIAYSGSGTISTTSASMTLRETYTGGGISTKTFNSYKRQ